MLTQDRNLKWILGAALLGALLSTPTLFVADVAVMSGIFGGVAAIVLIIVRKRKEPF
jgi:hypothetical protein